MLRRHAFGDGTGDFFQVLADQAGRCSVNNLPSGRRWAGDAPQACFWDGLDIILQVLGVTRPRHVLTMFWLACRF